MQEERRWLTRTGVCVLMLVACAGAAATIGCRSYWIDVSVENQTGQTIRELEVDYPSASFGFDTVASGAVMHYRLQARGRGPVRVAYSLPNGQTPHADGLTLVEHQHGNLIIRLLPRGKVQFLPSLQPAT